MKKDPFEGAKKRALVLALKTIDNCGIPRLYLQKEYKLYGSTLKRVQTKQGNIRPYQYYLDMLIYALNIYNEKLERSNMKKPIREIIQKSLVAINRVRVEITPDEIAVKEIGAANDTPSASTYCTSPANHSPLHPHATNGHAENIMDNKNVVHPPVGTLMKNPRTQQGAVLMTIDELHRRITEGYWKVSVEHLRKRAREGASQAEVAELKTHLPLFVACGDCRKRRMLKGFVDPSGYVPVDIDHISPQKVRQIVQQCAEVPWTKEAHGSVLEEGVHLFVKMGVIPLPESSEQTDDLPLPSESESADQETDNTFVPYVPARWEKAYTQEFKRRYALVCAEVSRLFGVEVDGQCKDVLRGFFVSYDPDAFCRPEELVENFPLPENSELWYLQETPDAEKPAEKPKEKPIPQATDSEATASAAGTPEVIVVKHERVRRFYKNNPYGQGLRHTWWVRFGCYLKFCGEPEAALKPYRDDMLAYLLKKKRMLEDDPYYRSKTEVDVAMQWGYDNKEEEDPEEEDTRRKESKAKPTKAEMVEAFLRGKPLRFDIISRKVQMSDTLLSEEPQPEDKPLTWVEMNDRDMNTLWNACNSVLGKDIGFQTFHNVLMSRVVPAINPLEEYIKALPAWDEQQPDYIGQVISMVHLATPQEDELFGRCFRKWFVAMVASWMQPDVVNHEVLVLIGAQGIYKTTWLDALMPPQLIHYRSKQSSSDRLDKDEMMRAAEFGLINLDEIDRMTDRELNALKSLITTAEINVRPAYGHGKERRPRIASYVASGNKDRFLSDTTGNRRWLPFRVTVIESPFNTALPYSGMYAQAYYLLSHGFSYWFTPDDVQALEQHVDDFRVVSNEEQLIPVYFEPARPGSEGAKFLTLAEIAAKLKYYGNLTQTIELPKLGKLMKKLGFEATRTGRWSVRGYIVRERNSEEIDSNRKLAILSSTDS